MGHHECVALLVAAAGRAERDADGRPPSSRRQQRLAARGEDAQSGGADPNDTAGGGKGGDGGGGSGGGAPLLVQAMAAGAEASRSSCSPRGRPRTSPGGVAPLSWPRERLDKLLTLLIGAGADLTVASDAGVTPLMILAAAGHTRGVKLLVEAAKASEAAEGGGGGAPLLTPRRRDDRERHRGAPHRRQAGPRQGRRRAPRRGRDGDAARPLRPERARRRVRRPAGGRQVR